MSWLIPVSLLVTVTLVSGCASVVDMSGLNKQAETIPAPLELVQSSLPELYQTNEPQVDVATPVASHTTIMALIDNSQLNRLVETTLEHNLDLQVTALRLRQQQLQGGIVEAGNKPSVTLSSNAQRMNEPLSNSTALNVNLAWEMDVWGRIAQQQGQADANTHIAVLDYQSAQSSLASRVIQQWLDIVYRHHILQVEQQWLASLQATEASIKERFLQGDGSLTDLEAARSSTASIKASLVAREQQQKDAWRQLALLQGRAFSQPFVIPSELPMIASPDKDITADVLVHRPDVAIAYENIIIANASKALAEKALLPSFSLSASVSNSGTNLDDLLSGSVAWNLLGNLTQPLFDGGRLKTDVAVNELQLEQAYLGFQTIYLNALHEAVGVLENEHSLAQQEQQMILAWQHAEASLKHYKSGYVQGLNDILSLLNAQQSAYSARMQMLQTQQSRIANRINLGLALGMGV